MVDIDGDNKVAKIGWFFNDGDKLHGRGMSLVSKE